jgi:serine/threonine-protein kinase
MDLAPGQVLGQYRIVGKIGEGGMGAVYKAEQPSVSRTVVIKVLSAAFSEYADARDRFRRELDMITRLEHPHILPVYDFGEVDGNPYIVMRFMTGGTLQDRMRRAALGRDEAIRLLEQIALALDFAHDRGIVHRDLKPGNVLLDDSANAYLADFGLAKSVGGTRDLTATGSVLGSPAYMSPEQARGDKLDRRSDIYSLAVMIYQMLSGRLPFDSDDAWGYITKHLSEEPAPIRRYAPDLSPSVEDALAAGLAKDREARPARASDLVSNVRQALAAPAGDRSLTRAARPATVSAPSRTVLGPAVPAAPARPARSNWNFVAVFGLGGLGLLVLGAIAAGVLFFGRDVLFGPKVTSYPVGDSPRALLAAGESIWVANFFGNNVTRLSASACAASPDRCGEAVGTYSVDDLPVALAYDGQHIWAASSLKQTLSALDPDTGEVTATYPVPHVPSALVWADSDIWTANSIAGTVTRVTREGQVLADLPVGQGPLAMAFDGTSLWVANKEGKSLVQVDPRASSVAMTLDLDGEPLAVVFDGRWLWVALADLGQVVQVDPRSASVGERIDVGADPSALVFDGESLWAAAPRAEKVFRIRLSDGRVIQTISVEGAPMALQSLSCGDGCWDIWTADESADAVSRIRIQ